MNDIFELFRHIKPIESIALFASVFAAGLLGLFKSFLLSQEAHKTTIDSLQRTIDALEEEIEHLRQQLKRHTDE